MSVCPFYFLFLGDACILPVCSGLPFKHPLSNLSLCVYLSKKKKTMKSLHDSFSSAFSLIALFTY